MSFVVHSDELCVPSSRLEILHRPKHHRARLAQLYDQYDATTSGEYLGAAEDAAIAF
jgi:hypothetical protein